MRIASRKTAFIVLTTISAFFLYACGGGGWELVPALDPAPDFSPTAITATDTIITADNAVLNGIVNPKGLATTAWFEHSKDPALASNVTTTATQTLGAGSTDINVTQSITGLDPGAAYYYRVKANSSAGTKSGAIYTFTTLPLPTVTTNSVTSKTTTGAVLNGDVNPNGRATTARFEYGKTTALGTFTDNQSVGSGTTSVQVAATLSGLDVATKYYYRIEATSTAGTSRGTILDFTTAGGVPTVATNSATSVTATGGVLNGIVNPNALATYAWFEYGTTSSLGTVIDNALRGSGTDNVSINKALTGLSAGTTIYYRVAANNSVGSATPGEILTFTTLNPAPVANAGPDQTDFQGHVVTLSGSGSSDGYGGTLSYLWAQTAGTSVTLSSTTAANPTFTAPTVAYPSQVLTFMLTVTSSRGPSATDNVNVTVKFGFFDDFSTNTTGTYTVINAPGNTGTFGWDGGNEGGYITAGGDNAIQIQRNLVEPANATEYGAFSMDFCPNAKYSPGARFIIYLSEGADTYYRIENTDLDNTSITPKGTVKKVVGGVELESQNFVNSYSQGTCYPIQISFSPVTTTVTAFGETIVLNVDGLVPVYLLSVETTHQDAFIDNIKLEALP